MYGIKPSLVYPNNDPVNLSIVVPIKLFCEETALNVMFYVVELKEKIDCVPPEARVT